MMMMNDDDDDDDDYDDDDDDLDVGFTKSLFDIYEGAQKH